MISVDVLDDQEAVAEKVAHYDLLAIPVVDDQHRMLGIITHDDVIDVVREEATEDAHRIGGVAPLEIGYLQTNLLTLCWNRGIWLAPLFFAALLTAGALHRYEAATGEVGFSRLVFAAGHLQRRQFRKSVGHAGDYRVDHWRRQIGRLDSRRDLRETVDGPTAGRPAGTGFSASRLGVRARRTVRRSR